MRAPDKRARDAARLSGKEPASIAATPFGSIPDRARGAQPLPALRQIAMRMAWKRGQAGSIPSHESANGCRIITGDAATFGRNPGDRIRAGSLCVSGQARVGGPERMWQKVTVEAMLESAASPQRARVVCFYRAQPGSRVARSLAGPR
ncbi:hypothetical protein PT2222_270040 [Paraburkholderia tropica]